MDVLDYWSIKNFEISSFSYPLKDRINKSYRTSGGDNSGLCLYTYNELGFRGDSITKNGFKVMSFGCSHTEGVGVNDHETWPSRVCQMIPDSVNHNFGTGGRSNDFIARTLLTFFDLIKPDLVLILYTYPHRREYYDSNGGINPYSPIKPWGFFKETEEGTKICENLILSQNDNEDLINWYKNHQLIKIFLENKGCNWIWDNSHVKTNYVDSNKFNGGFDEKFMDLGADKKHSGPLHHLNYSYKLIRHILKEHPEYLPPNSGYKKSIL
jgi:hypothetical protein